MRCRAVIPRTATGVPRATVSRALASCKLLCSPVLEGWEQEPLRAEEENGKGGAGGSFEGERLLTLATDLF